MYQSLINATKLVTGPRALALHEPFFDDLEKKYLLDCIDSTYVSSVGEYVKKFEMALEAYTGARHAIAVVNGTAALHISLILAGAGPGDEVLIPAMSFVATANSVLYTGAAPHFIDIEEASLGIDCDKLDVYLSEQFNQTKDGLINKKTNKRVKIIVPMHTFGHPSNIEGLLKICLKYNLVMVEDAAESLGSFYKDRHTGTYGLLGALSFNGNKTVTTGGGGAILTNSEELAYMARHLTTTAKLPHKYRFHHNQLGYNYRMPNINAALGLAQMEKIGKLIAAQRKLNELYSRHITFEGVRLFTELEDRKSNYWLQALIFDGPKNEFFIDEIVSFASEQGIACRPIWDSLATLPYLRKCQAMDLSATNSLCSRVLNIPSSPHLGL